VGDPLTFRLEAQDGYNHVTDIFATNVVARDPYSGRSIQLIDRFGCPVDPFVFPELDKLRDGDTLEARFNCGEGYGATIPGAGKVSGLMSARSIWLQQPGAHLHQL